MAHPSTKILPATLLLVILVIPFVFAAQIDDYKPYLHKATVPEHPKVKLYGSYSTSLFPGAATYAYSFDVPKGTHGLQPTLSISYNSQSVKQRPGVVGAGWSLTQNYIYRDTNITLSNTGDDAFKLVLNGASYTLVYVPTDGFWHTELESFIHVQNFSTGNNTYNMYWLVTNRDGTQYRFGFTNNSELTSNTGYSYAVRWSLDQVEDTFGNKIFYSYAEDPNAEDKGTAYLSQILYNNDQQRNISFVYESTSRPDSRTVYETGQKVDESRRLANISIAAAGTLVRTYHLDYSTNNENSISSLSKITFIGADGSSALHNITFEYYPSDTPEYQRYDETTWMPPTYFDNWQHEETGVRLADLNNDGFVDMVRKTESGVSTTWLNNRVSGWTDVSSSWALPGPAFVINDGKIDNGFRFVDLNSDGFTDIILSSNNDPGARKYTYLNNGLGGWQNVTGTGWDAPIYFTQSNQSRGVEFVDFNGDGRIDILQSTNQDATKKAYLNNGSGWTDVTGSWTIPTWFVDSTTQDTGARIVDLNGDGLVDIIESASGTRRAWLNHGAGWAENASWAPLVDFIKSDKTDTGVRIVDANGDGLPDLLQSLVNASGSNEAAWINNGNGWTQNNSWKPPTAFAQDNHNKGRRITDINGDGIFDILVSFDNTPSPGSNRSAQIRNTTTPFLLKKITNEFGGVVELQYNTSTRFNNTGDDYISDLGFNVWVVDKVKQNNSVAGVFAVAGVTSYNYSNGLYNSTDFEFRGFKQTTEFLADNSTVVHSFHQDKSLKGREYRTEIYNGSRNVFSITNNTYNSTLVNGYLRSFIAGEQSALYDGNATNPTVTKMSYSYDNYGNLLEKTSHGEDGLAGDEKTERSTFSVNTTVWIVDKISRSELSGNGTPTARVTRYFYDNVTFGSTPLVGALTNVENFLNGSKINPTSAFTYDSFGNTLTKIDALGHTTTLVYGIRDGTHTYADRVVNALDQPTDYSYDFGTGNLLYEEKNNIRKRFTYDTFGRPLKEILPYDNDVFPTKSNNYSFDGVAPETVKVSLREHSNVTSDVYYFYDGLGNLIQLKSPAEDNQQVVKNIYYDSLGRVAEEDNPYFDSFSTSLATPIAAVNKTRYTYDALARVTRVVNPDLTNKTIIYGHSTISDYDENGHRHDYTLDGFGQIVSVVEYNNDPLLGGTEKYNTTYAYSVAGELIGIMDALGNTFNFTFDTLGRKTVMDDPDMGHWTYSYDNAGNLVKQNDSESNITLLVYDNLNRIINKNSSSLNISFGYDQQFFGTLSNITGNYTFRYIYDDRMRIVKEEIFLEGAWFDTGASYDSMDRILEKRVPGQDLDYYYNKQGKVKTVLGYINTTSSNTFGSIVNRTYINGLTTTFAYQNNNNRLLSIRTGVVQELNYTYDNVGNIMSIIDTPHSLTYHMGYDYLDRLINTTIGNDIYRYTYNPLGNILHTMKKNETLRYIYGSIAHAPDSIITSKPAVEVYALRNVTFGSRNITFNFSLFNELNSTLSNVNWTTDWGDGTATNGSITSITVGSLANVTLQHNYTHGGDYTVNASVVAAGNVDQQKLPIKFGTRAHALKNIFQNISQTVYQFDIKNDVLENISNVNWTCAEISSTQEIKLSGNEIVNVLLSYNYSTAGKKSFNCKTDSSQGNESRMLLVDIPTLAVENYNTTAIDANKRQVQFTIKNYYSLLGVNWSVTSDGQLFNGTATLANGASTVVEQNITYATDGSKNIQVNVSSGSIIYDSSTDSFTLEALKIENYQRINKTAITSIFDFTVKNLWPQSLTAYWNLTDPLIVNSSVLNQNQSVMVFIEHQYSTQGLKTPVVNAYSGSFFDYISNIFTIKHVSIDDQQTLYSSASKAITELRTKSNTGSLAASWVFNTGTANITSTQLMTLTNNDTLVIIESNYTAGGVYPTSATVNSSLYSDNSTGVVVT